MKIKTYSELTTPDERTLRFTGMGFSMAGTLKPEDSAQFQQRVIAGANLQPDVPEGIQKSFERLRSLHSLGVLYYDAFTIAADLAWLVLEQAFRERFVTYFDGAIPLVNTKTEEEATLRVQNFDEVYQAVRRGKYAGKPWKLKVQATGNALTFRGNLSHLQKWARQENLLHGQRNRSLEPVYDRLRNSAAHPGHHLTMPPHSAGVIHDLAEIINRLWGHATPGGRLYPAPLARQVLVVAWTDSEDGPHQTICRDYQLAQFNDPGDWTCIVVRAVYEDEGLWVFDAQYERTNLPTELLWGPGPRDDALKWMNETQPQGDTCDYLDRLFALRVHGGKVSLARRPEVALALPSERRYGRWFVVRADHPNDAFAHVRHINNGVNCGDPIPTVRELKLGVAATSPPILSCAVEGVFDGKWEDMVVVLKREFNVAEPATLTDVRVPSPFSMVAPDVDAE